MHRYRLFHQQQLPDQVVGIHGIYPSSGDPTPRQVPFKARRPSLCCGSSLRETLPLLTDKATHVHVCLPSQTNITLARKSIGDGSQDFTAETLSSLLQASDGSLVPAYEINELFFGAPAAATPLPTSIVLFLSGLGLMGALTRRRARPRGSCWRPSRSRIRRRAKPRRRRWRCAGTPSTRRAATPRERVRTRRACQSQRSMRWRPASTALSVRDGTSLTERRPSPLRRMR